MIFNVCLLKIFDFYGNFLRPLKMIHYTILYDIFNPPPMYFFS